VTDHRFARVPYPVYDALERGEITSLQFEILAMMHRVADWRTGVVNSWSAKEYLFRCGETKPTEADERNVQRAQAGLRMMGWFRDTYKRGSKKPYVVTLNNFVVYGPTADSVGDDITDNEQSSYVLNVHELTPYATDFTDTNHEDGHRQDGDSVADDQRQMSAKDHMRSSPSASTTPAALLPLRRAGGQSKTDGAAASDRLREVIGWVPDSAVKTLDRLLQTFTFEEIFAELKPCVDSQWGISDTKDIAAKFAKGGAQLEAELRRHRKVNQVVEGLVSAGVDRENACRVVRQEGVVKILVALRADGNKKLKAAALKAATENKL
jgi:hypothetical protein